MPDNPPPDNYRITYFGYIYPRSPNKMQRSKTLIDADQQWEQSVKYIFWLHRTRWTDWRKRLKFHQYQVSKGYAKPIEINVLIAKCTQERDAGPRVAEDEALWLARGTHTVFKSGDVLIARQNNGMHERFPMTGVTSKGARLCNYYLPLRVCRHRDGFLDGIVELPGDLIGLRWDDPAVGRFVADLRASCRSRVSANSPASSHGKISAGIDTNEIHWFGLYKSGRTTRSRRKRDYRHYLRFYPDGSVAYTLDPNHQGWRISFEPNNVSPSKSECSKPMGVVNFLDRRVTFELFDNGKVFFARYDGQFENGRLWLTCDSPHSSVAHQKLPYLFHPFNQDEFVD